MSNRPRLWQIEISHFSEKARWALAYKRVEHQRRTPPPGAHMAVALWLTRGESKTFPILELDGERFADSSLINAALERRFPQIPLYPDDPEEHARAGELEAWFGDEVGPHTRLLAWHEAIKDPEFATLAARVIPRPLDQVGRVAAPMAASFLRLRYHVSDDDAAETARGKIVAGFDRIESELGDGEYLVGDRFGVADLSAAALMYPIVMPPEAPELPTPPEALARFRDSLSARPGFEWVQEMFRRHRHVAFAGNGQGSARRAGDAV